MMMIGLMMGAALAAMSAVEETAQWQAAIDAAALRGSAEKRAVVTVPPGRHVVGQLDLKSNVELHLEKGAILEGMAGIKNYRVLKLPYSEGDWSAVVFAYRVENVAITGEGEIFGNGDKWPWAHGYHDNREGMRPRGIFFGDSKRIELADFTLRDAACWGCVFKCCDGVTARRVKIENIAHVNNDGFDIEAKNVLIEDCDVSAEDDAYCIKSNTPDFIVENIRIRNCVGRSFCNVFKLGTASHGTMRDIRFEHCRSAAMPRTFMSKWLPPRENYLLGTGRQYMTADAGLCSLGAIVVECVDGGIVENIVFDDIEIAACMAPIFIRGGTRKGRGCGIPPSNHRVLRDVVIRNVRGRSHSWLASSISGVEGCIVKNVRLENVDLEIPGAGIAASTAAMKTPVPDVSGQYPEVNMFRTMLPVYGLYVDKVEGLQMTNVKFHLRPGTQDARPAISEVANH